MSKVNHSFDWRGCYFAFKVFAVCLAVLGAGHWGFVYALAYFTQPTPSTLVAIQDTPTGSTDAAAELSSTTPQRIINVLTIAEAVPPKAKFIAADLVNMKLYLYENGTTTAEYPILTKGKPGTPWETPSGFYAIQTKEQTHFSTIGHVYMPYSMQFYGNYFIHGLTYYPDGTPVSASFSGGCIKLSTADAEQVFAFADIGTRVFAYDSKQDAPLPPLVLTSTPTPHIDAHSYLVADIDTGDIYAEQNAQERRPIASVTKLMTALVANETISLDKKIAVQEGELANPQDMTNTIPKTFLVGDLFYPLLMQSNNAVADSLAAHYGTRGFVAWMNTTAQALGMISTTFADTSGISPDDVSTPEDLYRLAVYLTNKKSFVWNITRAPSKTIVADDGSHYTLTNFNAFSDLASFVGGKVGHTTQARDTMVSVFSLPIDGEKRRIAVVVLDSNNYTADTQKLVDWFTTSAGATPNAACASCAPPPNYRQIPL
ncbi:MAG: L,D-transpeptidase family protein [bacterium]|nr:L,D-transpeptidase family protein [bacterium]